MRAHTITTKSRPRRKVRNSVLALVLGVCALAIPASASAVGPGSGSSADAIAGGSSDSSQPNDGGAVTAGHAHRTPTELAQRTAPPEPTLVSGSPASTSDGFDWASAAVGAGAAMALVALAGAALLTIRRRAPVSPSAPTS